MFCHFCTYFLFLEGFRSSLNDHTHVFKTFAATCGKVFWRDSFVAFLMLVCILLGLVLFVLGKDLEKDLSFKRASRSLAKTGSSGPP